MLTSFRTVEKEFGLFGDIKTFDEDYLNFQMNVIVS